MSPRWLLSLALAAGVTAAVVGVVIWGWQARPASECAPYHPDPDHLWNRLHDALFVRHAPDGTVHGRDRLEPLLWTSSKHLLDGEPHRRAVDLLQRFLHDHGERLLTDPLKRAMLQRDLWLVFDWLEGTEDTPARHRLRPLLASAVARLTLSAEDISRLPSNADHADLPYLSRDLFAADGPWVCVGRTDGPTAPLHLRDDGTNRFVNSTFLVFLRLPGGRDATLAYLKQLFAFAGPLMVEPGKDLKGAPPFVPNAEVPQFPKGTAVALVRRALLVATSGRVVPSPLTESVQVRIQHGEPPPLSMLVLDDALSGSDEGRQRMEAWQSSHEARLSRAALFAGRAGGLIDVTDDPDHKTGFGSHPYDSLEASARSEQRFAPRQTCVLCHGLPGVFAFNSYQDFRSGLGHRGGTFRPLPLAVMSVAEVEAAAVRSREGRPSWAALRRLAFAD